MREALRESEEKVFNALADFIKLNAYPPTIRELCNLTEITSTSSVYAILKSLETKGYIKTAKNQRRALSIVSTTADVVEVVRCKDCKNCDIRYPLKEIGKKAVIGYFCEFFHLYVGSTDFCSYGVRKEGAENADKIKHR